MSVEYTSSFGLKENKTMKCSNCGSTDMKDIPCPECEGEGDIESGLCFVCDGEGLEAQECESCGNVDEF